VEESLALALWGTRKGTLSAAMAAGVAYASLVAMQFRGFRQFGVIGGLGMVLAWGTTFVLMPPLVAWLDRGGNGPRPREHGRGPVAAIARAVTARPRVFALGATVLTLLAAWEVRGFGRNQLEYDFSRLRRHDTWTSGEGYWGKKMDVLLHRYLTPTAILTDSAAEARAVEARLRAAGPPLRDMIASIRSYDDLVPPDAAEKADQVHVIRRKLTANVRNSMTAGDRDKLERLIGRPTGSSRSGPATCPRC
jgi:hypothetical protein